MFTPCRFPWSKAPLYSTRVRKILVSSKISSWSNQNKHQAYAVIPTEEEVVAKNLLEKFVVEKNYNVESSIVDAVINKLAKITSCIIKVHYQCGYGSFDQHAIPPVDPLLPDTPCIELAFINALCFLLFHIMLLSVTLQRQRSLPHQLLSWTRAKRRGDNHWHSILCRGDSINLVLLLHPFFSIFCTFFVVEFQM